MDFPSALDLLKQGHKISLPEWGGFWVKEDGKVMAYLKDGSVCEATQTFNIFREDWKDLGKDSYNGDDISFQETPNGMVLYTSRDSLPVIIASPKMQ